MGASRSREPIASGFYSRALTTRAASRKRIQERNIRESRERNRRWSEERSRIEKEWMLRVASMPWWKRWWYQVIG